jgi:type II secretory pathway component PulJ
MRFAARTNKKTAAGAVRPSAGFTLAEVLAALLFMAIVLPVAIEGLHIASLGGTVAVTKGEAARIAEQVLNENLVSTNWSQTLQGTTTEGQRTFGWTLNSDPWTQDPSQNVIRQLSVRVTYNVRGRECQVRLSTLVDSSLALGITGTTSR